MGSSSIESIDSQINKIESILNGIITDNLDKEFLQVDYTLRQQNDESSKLMLLTFHYH